MCVVVGEVALKETGVKASNQVDIV